MPFASGILWQWCCALLSPPPNSFSIFLPLHRGTLRTNSQTIPFPILSNLLSSHHPHSSLSLSLLNFLPLSISTPHIYRNHLKKGVVICGKESEAEKKRQGVYPSVGNPTSESSRVICRVTVGSSHRFLEKCQVYGFIMVAIENRLTRPRCCSSPEECERAGLPLHAELISLR